MSARDRGLPERALAARLEPPAEIARPDDDGSDKRLHDHYKNILYDDALFKGESPLLALDIVRKTSYISDNK